MNRLKSMYVSTYIGLGFAGFFYALSQILQLGFTWQAGGALLANLPIVLLMTYLFLFSAARTSANLNSAVVVSVIGALVAIFADNVNTLLLVTGIVGCLGMVGYVYWYSRFGDRANDQLVVGNTLPQFELEDELGNSVSSQSWLGNPALIMFYRGNWCPLCMAQIKEVAAQYQALADLGVQVVMVSPQPHKQTAALVSKFNVPFKFLVDKDNRAAKALNIESLGGTPFGMEVLGYETDTVMPTVLITDAKAKIIFADLTDNYRVRPEPETFFEVFKTNGIA